MLFLKSVGVGLAAAVATSLLWLLVVVVLPIYLRYVYSRHRYPGSGGIGAVSSNSFDLLVIAAIAFVIGFVWTFKRG